MGITLHVDVRDLVTWEGNVKGAVRRAVKMGGSSALRAMRAEGSRRIREKKGVRPSHIDSALSVHFPTRKDVLVWALRAKSKPLPLFVFGARQVKSGTSVEVTKGKRAVVKHAFIATMQSGHEGVFMRRGPKRVMQKGRYKGKRRQPIYEAFSASVAPALGAAAPQVMDRAVHVFTSTFLRLLPGETAKRSTAS